MQRVFSFKMRVALNKGGDFMLNENLKTVRKAKGLSQEELAVKLNVVRQTISKWEQGLSVPDADMLIAISEELEIPVSTLLGETIQAPDADNLKAISEKLEVINYQLAQRKATRKKLFFGVIVGICLLMGITFVALLLLGSPYLDWDYSDPELAVAGVLLHAFEWFFVRIAPLLIIAGIVIIAFVRKKG